MNMKKVSCTIKRVLLLLILILGLLVHSLEAEEATETYSNNNADAVTGSQSDETPMEKVEREALYSAIQGFVGDWWNGSDLYPDPCGWTPIQGVDCDLYNGFWYVTALNIGPVHENSLVCADEPLFRPQLFELKHLKSLSFYDCFRNPGRNPITILSTDWLNLVESLETLEFRSNPGLIGQIPSSFANLTKLQSLVLLENGLTGELSTDLGKLSDLKRLVLSGNKFTGQVPDSFGGFSQLLILDLSRNALSGHLPSSIGNLASLLKLDLSDNQFEGNLPKELGNLKKVVLLDLGNNKLSGGIAKSLEEMSSLEELVLSRNQLGGDLKNLEWNKLHNLAVLDLASMGLSGEIPESLSQLKRLRYLGLSNNNLTGNPLPQLAALPNINTLYLDGNNLTGELNFSVWFYRKMGRRFGAWDNPNLCYLMSTSDAPFGVKPCQQEANLLQPSLKANLGDGNMDQHSSFMASLGFSSFVVNEFWFLFLVEVVVMVVVLAN